MINDESWMKTLFDSNNFSLQLHGCVLPKILDSTDLKNRKIVFKYSPKKIERFWVDYIRVHSRRREEGTSPRISAESLPASSRNEAIDTACRSTLVWHSLPKTRPQIDQFSRLNIPQSTLLGSTEKAYLQHRRLKRSNSKRFSKMESFN